MNENAPVLNRELLACANADYAADIRSARLRRGGSMSIAVVDDASHTVLYGEGGGCALNLRGGGEAVLVPLRGCVAVHTANFVASLRAGEIFITEHDQPVRAVGHGHARWLALLAGRSAWQRILPGLHTGHAFDTRLLPTHHAADREVRRSALALARAETTGLREIAMRVVVGEIVALQAPLHDAISRCPGRTHAKRLHAFLRLQRVRNFISHCCDQRLDNETLARMANYSPCHFLRMFNRVFQETPHNYLLDQRLQQAMQLLRTSDLAIHEIAAASGFENRSAFSRSFRERFGKSANGLRQELAAGIRASGVPATSSRGLANPRVTEVVMASELENHSAFSRVFRQRFCVTAQEFKRRHGYTG